MKIWSVLSSLVVAVTITMVAGSGFAQQSSTEPASPPAVMPATPPPAVTPPSSAEKVVTPPAPENVIPPPAGPEAPVAAPAKKAEFGYLVCYREKRFVGAALNTSVYVDDVEIADMDNGCYIIVKVKPGDHKLYGDEKKDALSIKVEAGKAYYYRMELAWGVWKGHGRLTEVESASGEKEFKDWKLKFAPDIKQADMVVKELGTDIASQTK